MFVYLSLEILLPERADIRLFITLVPKVFLIFGLTTLIFDGLIHYSEWSNG